MNISALVTRYLFVFTFFLAIPVKAEENILNANYNFSPSDHIEIKMGELEKQFANLTNEIERLKYELSMLQQKQNQINADVSLHFKDLETQLLKLQTPSQTTQKEEKTQELTPKQEYEAAYAILKKNDFPNAEQAFINFIKKYPKEELAGNAQYWLGETYFVRKNYDKAAVAFAEAYQKYPTNYKAPDNFLKLGLSMKELGKKDEACAVFKNYAKEYPKAPVAFIKRAEKEAGIIGCK